jgi:hypothetical protein
MKRESQYKRMNRYGRLMASAATEGHGTIWIDSKGRTDGLLTNPGDGYQIIEFDWVNEAIKVEDVVWSFDEVKGLVASDPVALRADGDAGLRGHNHRVGADGRERSLNCPGCSKLRARHPNLSSG